MSSNNYGYEWLCIGDEEIITNDAFHIISGLELVEMVNELMLASSRTKVGVFKIIEAMKIF
jgi:hypothetical protein